MPQVLVEQGSAALRKDEMQKAAARQGDIRGSLAPIVPHAHISTLLDQELSYA